MIRVIPGSVPRRRENMLQGRPKNRLAGHSAGKGCLFGICRGGKTQNQYSSRLCRESTCFHGIAVPPYWFHSYIFEIVTIVVYWFCGRGKHPRPYSRTSEVQSYATTLWEALLMTASLRVKNDKYYVVLTHTTDGKKIRPGSPQVCQ